MHEHHYFDGRKQALSTCDHEGLGHTHRIIINGVVVETGTPKMTMRGHVHEYEIGRKRYVTGVGVFCSR